MEVKYPMAGELNRQIEFLENVAGASSSGVVNKENLTSLGTMMAKRLGARGNEDSDGRLVGVGICRYQMRFDANLFAKSSKLVVRDFDGDWQIIGPPQLLGGRKRYVEITCKKRG